MKEKSLTKVLTLTIIILSILGMTDAGYLLYQGLTNQIPPCSNAFQCEKVLTSEYAKIGPFPLSAFGLFYYISVFLLTTWMFLEIPIPSKFRWIKKYGFRIIDKLQILTSIGFIFSLYLVFIMAFVLKAWCFYCLLSAFISLSIFTTTTLLAKKINLGESYFIKGLILNIGMKFYQFFLKPIFFLIDPETIHEKMIFSGSMLSRIKAFKFILSFFLGFSNQASHVTFAGITFPNRIGLSAGYDYNADLTNVLDTVGYGWQTVGTITLEAYGGNSKPRLTRLKESKGLIVNKGLKNIGVHAVIEKLAFQHFPIPVAISIASTNKHFSSTKEQLMDIAQTFILCEKAPLFHKLYELNISCPNTFGGEPFTNCPRLEVLLTLIDRLNLSRPVFVKLPIDQSQEETLSLLEVIDRHKIAGVIFGNLTKDHNNPEVSENDKKLWNSLKGNVSGKPTFHRSNLLIALTKKHFGKRFIIVGTGGIFSPEDAQQKIELGADLVQLITGMIYQGPQLIGLINRKLTFLQPTKIAD